MKGDLKSYMGWGEITIILIIYTVYSMASLRVDNSKRHHSTEKKIVT